MCLDRPAQSLILKGYVRQHGAIIIYAHFMGVLKEIPYPYQSHLHQRSSTYEKISCFFDFTMGRALELGKE